MPSLGKRGGRARLLQPRRGDLRPLLPPTISKTTPLSAIWLTPFGPQTIGGSWTKPQASNRFMPARLKESGDASKPSRVGRAADSTIPSPLPAQRNSRGEGRVRGGKLSSAARLGCVSTHQSPPRNPLPEASDNHLRTTPRISAPGTSTRFDATGVPKGLLTIAQQFIAGIQICQPVPLPG